jgi:hypothetical protein
MDDAPTLSVWFPLEGQTPVADTLGPSIQWRMGTVGSEVRGREGQPAARVENWGPLPSGANEVFGCVADLEEPDRPSGKVAGLLLACCRVEASGSTSRRAANAKVGASFQRPHHHTCTPFFFLGTRVPVDQLRLGQDGFHVRAERERHPLPGRSKDLGL